MSHLFFNWKFVLLNLPHLFLSSLYPIPLWQPPVCSLYFYSGFVLLCLFICFVFYFFPFIFFFGHATRLVGLSSLTRDRTQDLVVELWSPNHWTIRDFPLFCFWFHIQMKSYSFCLSLSALFHLEEHLLGPSTLRQTARFHSLTADNTPHCLYPFIYW